MDSDAAGKVCVANKDGSEVYGPVSVDTATASFAVQATDAEGDLITIRIIPDSILDGKTQS